MIRYTFRRLFRHFFSSRNCYHTRMSYVFFNPNPLGKKVGDCVIRAISKLTEQDWQTVYMDVTLAGYELCDMPSSNNVWAAYLKRLGFHRNVIPDTCPNCYTVKDFCRDNPRGKFLLATGSHVVTVVDGNSFDAWDSGDETPIYFWS